MDRSNIPEFYRLLKTFQTLVSILLNALNWYSAYSRAPVNVFFEVLSRPVGALCMLPKRRWDGYQTTAKHLTKLFFCRRCVSLISPSSADDNYLGNIRK